MKGRQRGSEKEKHEQQRLAIAMYEHRDTARHLSSAE